MDRPPRPPNMFPDATEPSVLPKALLAVGAGIVGAALGAALTVLARRWIGFYIPMLPGFFAASAITRVYASDAIAIGAIGALCGFVGGVLAEAFIYVNPGVVHYMIHFYENGTTTDWIFRILNAGVGFWYSRATQRAPLPGSPSGAEPSRCPSCSRGNLPGAKFCSHCGEQMR